MDPQTVIFVIAIVIILAIAFSYVGRSRVR